MHYKGAATTENLLISGSVISGKVTSPDARSKRASGGTNAANRYLPSGCFSTRLFELLPGRSCLDCYDSKGAVTAPLTPERVHTRRSVRKIRPRDPLRPISALVPYSGSSIREPLVASPILLVLDKNDGSKRAERHTARIRNISCVNIIAIQSDDHVCSAWVVFKKDIINIGDCLWRSCRV